MIITENLCYNKMVYYYEIKLKCNYKVLEYLKGETRNEREEVCNDL